MSQPPIRNHPPAPIQARDDSVAERPDLGSSSSTANDENGVSNHTKPCRSTSRADGLYPEGWRAAWYKLYLSARPSPANARDIVLPKEPFLQIYKSNWNTLLDYENEMPYLGSWCHAQEVEIKRLKSDIAQAQVKVTTLEMSHTRLAKDKLDDQETACRAMNREKEQSGLRVAELRRDLVTLEQDKERTEKCLLAESTVLRADLYKQRLEIESLKADHRKLEQEEEQRKLRFVKLMGLFNELVQKHNELSQKHDKVKTLLRTANTTLRAENLKLKTIPDGSKPDEVDPTKNRQNVTSDAEALANDYRKLEQQAKQANLRVANLIDHVSKLSQEKQKIETRLEAETAALHTTEIELEKVKEQTKVSKQIECTEVATSEHLYKLRQVFEELRKLRQESQEKGRSEFRGPCLKTHVGDFEPERQKWQAHCATLRDKMLEIHNKKTALEKELKDPKRDPGFCRFVQGQVDKLLEKNKVLEKEVKDFRERELQFGADIKDLTQRLESKTAESQANIDALERRILLKEQRNVFKNQTLEYQYGTISMLTKQVALKGKDVKDLQALIENREKLIADAMERILIRNQRICALQQHIAGLQSTIQLQDRKAAYSSEASQEPNYAAEEEEINRELQKAQELMNLADESEDQYNKSNKPQRSPGAEDLRLLEEESLLWSSDGNDGEEDNDVEDESLSQGNNKLTTDAIRESKTATEHDYSEMYAGMIAAINTVHDSLLTMDTNEAKLTKRSPAFYLNGKLVRAATYEKSERKEPADANELARDACKTITDHSLQGLDEQELETAQSECEFTETSATVNSGSSIYSKRASCDASKRTEDSDALEVAEKAHRETPIMSEKVDHEASMTTEKIHNDAHESTEKHDHGIVTASPKANHEVIDATEKTETAIIEKDEGPVTATSQHTRNRIQRLHQSLHLPRLDTTVSREATDASDVVDRQVAPEPEYASDESEWSVLDFENTDNSGDE